MFLLEALFWLSLNLYHEARSEDKLTQIAIAHVTLNRAKSKSIKEVVLSPDQFSWTKQKTDYFPYDLKSFLETTHSSLVAIQGFDFTGGATFYHRVDVKPYWRKDLELVGVYGRHKFYRRKS